MKLINKLRDYFRLKFYRLRYDFTQGENVSFSWGDLKTIVICKIDGKLGDSEVISPFIVSLQKNYPGLQIIVLTSASLKGVYSECVGVKRVITCSHRPSKLELNCVVSQIGGCDLFVTLEAKFRFHDYYLLYMLKPKLVVGINHDVDSVNININEFEGCSHITDYFKHLLTLGGLPSSQMCTEYVSFVTPAALLNVKKYVKQNMIAIAPWGASKHKRLNDEVVVQTARLVVSLGYAVILLVPPGGGDLRKIVEKNVQEKFLVRVPEKMSINELSAFIASSVAIISVDTANVHLACATHTPVFGIYSGEHDKLRVLWAPQPTEKNATVFYLKDKTIDKLTFSDMHIEMLMFLNRLSRQA